MNRTLVGSAIGMALMCAGCAGVQYIIDNYKGVQLQRFTSPSQKTLYRIFDKPSENRMMITSSLSDSMGQGLVKSVTFTDTTPPEILFERAAIEFLASKGRTCTAKRTYLLVTPQFEVLYSCN